MTASSRSFRERMLRDQIVSGINDVTMQTRLLETADLEFETAKNTVIAMVASRKDSRALCTQLPQATVVQSEESESVVKTKQQASGSCFHCGENHRAPQCRHMSSVCFKCEQRGHLARVCRSQTAKARFRNGPKPVHNLDDELASTEYRPEKEGAYDLWTLQAAGPEPMRVEVSINGVTLDLELDTGASVSTISERKFTQLFPSARLETSEVQLGRFSGDTKPVVGKFVATVELGEI
ncbi:uncharacterized protein LOC144119512 [Amblyomma americanum]